MSVAETRTEQRRRRKVRAAISGRGGRLKTVARQVLGLPVYLVRRIVRSISFRARYGPERVYNELLRFSLLIKRQTIFPVRNALWKQKPLRVKVAGERFSLVPEGAVAFDIFARRQFDAKRELEFILPLLHPRSTFVDVGANVGVFSIPAGKKLREGRVFAFEPSSWTYERLIRNIHLNHLDNIQTIQSAVGDRIGEATLQINVSGKDGLNTIGSPAHEDSEIAGREHVPITTLDHFLRENSVPQVDVLKIDVEGAELFVLRGGENLLRGPKAPLILYEGGFLSKGLDYHPVEEMWLLEKHGYTFFVIDSHTGELSKPKNSRAYDAMIVAVKANHAAYAAIGERAR